MGRGFSGSGNQMSLRTAIPKIFVSNITSTGADIRWANRPANDRTAILVFVSTTQTLPSDAEAVDTLGDVGSTTLTGLTLNTQYWVFVRNMYGTEKSDDCVVDFITSNDEPVITPLPISNLARSDDYYTSFSLSWSNPDSDFDGIRFTISVWAELFLYSFDILHTDKSVSLFVDNLPPNHRIGVSAVSYLGSEESTADELEVTSLPSVEAIAMDIDVNQWNNISIDASLIIPLRNTDEYSFGISKNVYSPNPDPLPDKQDFTYDTLPALIEFIELTELTHYYLYANVILHYVDRQTEEPVRFVGIDSSIDTITPAEPPAV
jgi:hypothetical protein